MNCIPSPAHILAQGTNVPFKQQCGITYVHAGNGVFKHASNGYLGLMIQVAEHNVPGLVNLLPTTVIWPAPDRVPAEILDYILNDARHAAKKSKGGAYTPIEKQYFILWHDNDYMIHIPPQDSSAARIQYDMPDGAIVLIDLHSHHGMPAHFSHIDDQDDTGLSISCVIGNIYTRPEIHCRLNVYGDHHPIAAGQLFNHTLQEVTD